MLAPPAAPPPPPERFKQLLTGWFSQSPTSSAAETLGSSEFAGVLESLQNLFRRTPVAAVLDVEPDALFQSLRDPGGLGGVSKTAFFEWWVARVAGLDMPTAFSEAVSRERGLLGEEFAALASEPAEQLTQQRADQLARELRRLCESTPAVARRMGGMQAAEAFDGAARTTGPAAGLPAVTKDEWLAWWFQQDPAAQAGHGLQLQSLWRVPTAAAS